MINETLLDWNYYKKKLPNYVRDSFGIENHFEYLIEIFKQLDIVYDDIFQMFNVFNDNYLNWINSLEGNEDGTVSEVLDLIGYIYGVSRVFDCTYENVYFEDADHELLQTYTEPLILTNKEFLNLIKATIIQQSFNGNYSQAREFYDNIDLPILYFNNANPATAFIYLCLTYNNEGERIDDFTDNELKMFMAGLFTIKSVGIVYTYRMGDVENLMIWDSMFRLWDNAVWS